MNRYKPSFRSKGNLVPRFVQLTESMIIYYGSTHKIRNVYDGRQHERIPLFRIPLESVHHARPLNLEESQKLSDSAIQSKNEKVNTSKAQPFFFEIELK